MSFRLFCFLICAIVLPGKALASKCPTDDSNPYDDVVWKCMFPFVIGAAEIGEPPSGSEGSNDGADNNDFFCECDSGIPGIWFSMWDPASIIDTVSDPYCFMPLGQDMGGDGARLAGGHTQGDGSAKTFQQLHYYIFPTWNILGYYYDVECILEERFDVFMMTEVMPTWNDDQLSTIINPESTLFANPLATLACSADSLSVSVAKRSPINALFWCMGSWGNAYPLAGSITGTDYVAANAGIAARGIYMMARFNMLKERTEDGCGESYSSIWSKDIYKLQLMKPVKDSACRPIGRTGYIWTGYKHPIMERDNFSWLLFRKLKCCLAM